MMKFIRRDHIPTDRRPLGYWLRAIEGQLRGNMRAGWDPEKPHGPRRGRGHGPHRGHQLKRGLV